LVDAVIQAKQQALEHLNESSFGGVPVALQCPGSWRQSLLQAFEKAGFHAFDVLTRGAVEAACFYDHFEQQLAPLLSKWLELCQHDPEILRHSTISRELLERSQRALVEKRMTVAIVGAMKAGKSTFLNALLGRFVMPAMDKRCTRRRFVLRNADPLGEGKRLEVHLLGSTSNAPIRSTRLSLDADELGWSTEQLRSYLFALNAPNLIEGAKTQLDRHEQMLLHDFQQLPFASEDAKKEVHEALRDEAAKIDTIWLTHPFHNLPFGEVGLLELWDTPGPNAIEEEAEEAFDERRILSDREAFERAVKDSSALLVIFDVMQQEAQAQDEVLKIVSQRHGEAGSILIIANKVDLRPKRGVLPLGELLAEVQKQAYDRYGMSIRPPIPTSSRPAQLAREIMAYGSVEDAPEDLQEEYDAVERREDRKANEEQPEKAVEARSGIVETEMLLKRFFRQEPGRAILQDATTKLLTLLEDNHNHQQQILSAQEAEQAQFQAAANVLDRGYATLAETQDEATTEFEQAYQTNIHAMKQGLKRAKSSCLQAVEQFWNRQFGSSNKLNKSSFESKRNKAYTETFTWLQEATELFDEAHRKSIQETIPMFWEAINNELRHIESNAAQELGMIVEEKTLEDSFQVKAIYTNSLPSVKFDSNTKKDESYGENIGTGAAIGAGVGTALGVVGGILAGPIGWAVLAGAAAGAAAGAGAGAANTKDITEYTASKSNVIKAYKNHFSSLFDSWEKENLARLKQVKSATRKQIDQTAQDMMNQMKERLEVARALAVDPHRKEKILRLQHFLTELEQDMEPLRRIATRLDLGKG
jgi:GTPase SAR1 family protein